MSFDRKMIEVLICPHSNGPLQISPDRTELISMRAGVAFPIRDGVPMLFIEEARALEEHERAKYKR